jgi:predicted branched-subunit amino acid permease
MSHSSVQPYTKANQGAKQAFFGGVKALLPITPGVIPFGLVTGVAATEYGFSVLESMGMTLLFFAGSAQMVALQLLRDDALPLVIFLTVMVINLRFMMYSASLAPYLHTMPMRWKIPLSYMMSDQAYAMSIAKLTTGESHTQGHCFFAGAAITMWTAWNISVFVGALLGAGIPASLSLEFAIPLAFLALLVPAIKTSAHLGAACVGGLMAVLAIDMPYNLGLITAGICGITTGLMIERVSGRRPVAHEESESHE